MQKALEEFVPLKRLIERDNKFTSGESSFQVEKLKSVEQSQETMIVR